MKRVLLLSVALILTVGQVLVAQSERPFSMDVHLGIDEGWGGKYFDRVGLVGELTLVPDHDGAAIGAFSVGFRGTPASSDICRIDPGTVHKCLDRFPSLAHVGLLGGLERTFPGGALRAMAGAAFYHGNETNGVGPQAQVDATVGFTHLLFVVAGRGSMLVRSGDSPVRLGAIEFGLRMQ